MTSLLLTVDYTDGHLKNGRSSFWADSFIKNKGIKPEEGENLHLTVKRAIEEIDNAEMCHKGKPLSNVYRDINGESVIIGYVYRVKHYIADRSANFCGYAYFDAWVTIKQTQNLELQSIEV